METGQRSIEGFFNTGLPQIDAAATSSTTPTQTPNKKRKRSNDQDEGDDDVIEVVSGSGSLNQTLADSDGNHFATSHSRRSVSNEEDASSSSPSSYMCDRCKKRIALPQDLADIDDEIKAEALAALRQEHDDWHFAQDLSRQPAPDERRHSIRPQSSKGGNGSGVHQRSPPKSKKRLKDKDSKSDKGIAKFFSKS